MRVLAQALMDAEVSAQIGAEHSQRNPERTTHRNGYRARDWDTRVGTIDLQIPRVRECSSTKPTTPLMHVWWVAPMDAG